MQMDSVTGVLSLEQLKLPKKPGPFTISATVSLEIWSPLIAILDVQVRAVNKRDTSMRFLYSGYFHESIVPIGPGVIK